MESIFALANGYLGLRGTQDEGRPVYDPAPMLNGFYETWPMVYPERAYGFAETGQAILGLPDGTVLRLYVDDEAFSLDQVDVLEYERALDMRTGMLERRVVWRATDGSRYVVRSRRLVSFANRHLACVEYEVTCLDRAAHLTISSDLMIHPENGALDSDDPRRNGALGTGALQKVEERADGQRVILAYRTRTSGLQMACGMDHQLVSGTPTAPPQTLVDGDWARVVYQTVAEQDKPIRIVKYVAYHHDGKEPAAELCFRVSQTLERAVAQGIEQRVGGPAILRGRLLDSQRRHHRRRASAAAGGPLQSVPVAPGLGPRGGTRYPGQGLDRPRLRGPLLLGCRDLRHALPHLHGSSHQRRTCCATVTRCSTRPDEEPSR